MSVFDLVTLAVLVIAGAAYLYDYVSEEPTAEERLRERYAAGEIDHAEFERRIAEVVDDEFQATVAELQTINGIGPSTARSLARAFESRQAIREADRDALERVNGVGSSTAEAIQKRYDG